MVKELYTHSDNPQGQRHRLDVHLKAVVELSRKFADKFVAGDLAYWAGLWHVLGKYDVINLQVTH